MSELELNKVGGFESEEEAGTGLYETTYVAEAVKLCLEEEVGGREWTGGV